MFYPDPQIAAEGEWLTVVFWIAILGAILWLLWASVRRQKSFRKAMWQKFKSFQNHLNKNGKLND